MGVHCFYVDCRGELCGKGSGRACCLGYVFALVAIGFIDAERILFVCGALFVQDTRWSKKQDLTPHPHDPSSAADSAGAKPGSRAGRIAVRALLIDV